MKKERQRKEVREAGRKHLSQHNMPPWDGFFTIDSYFPLLGLKDFESFLGQHNGKRIPFKRSTALIFLIIFVSQELCTKMYIFVLVILVSLNLSSSIVMKIFLILIKKL